MFNKIFKAYSPVNESTLGIHQVELVIQTSPGFSDGRGVGQHAHCSLHLCQITSWHDSRGLVVDTDLEASWTPIHKLNSPNYLNSTKPVDIRFRQPLKLKKRLMWIQQNANLPLGLDGGNCSVDILRHDITTIQHAAGHVLPVTGVTLHHLVGRLEASVGDFCDWKLLMVRLLRTNDLTKSSQRRYYGLQLHRCGCLALNSLQKMTGTYRCVSGQWEMDTRVRDQVGLELCQVNVQCTIESEGSSDWGHNLTNQTIQVRVSGSLNVQVAPADVVDGLIVHHESTVRVLQSRVGCQDGVVRFDNSSGHLESVTGQIRPVKNDMPPNWMMSYFHNPMLTWGAG